jgi:hypothetical protein
VFDDPPDDMMFGTKETVGLTAGRIETLRHTVRHKVDWMTSDRRNMGERMLPDRVTIGRVETRVERAGDTL